MTPFGSSVHGGSAPAVVVAGDALVDLTPTPEVSGTAAYVPHPGGSCLNVAVGLGRLEVPVALLARVSTDPFGQLLRRHLDAAGVQPDHLVDTGDLTTLAAVHLQDGEASYTFHAAEAADRGLRPEHLRALPPGAALHLGSIALALEPVASTLDGLLRQEAGRRLISLDPNIRPGLIAHREAYLRRFAAWLPSVDLLKLSEDDLEWLAGDRRPTEVIADWHAAGVGLVLLTRGADGAYASTSAATAQVPAPPVAVVDTVGAGDAFTAGALAHLHTRGLLSAGGVRSLDTEGLAALLGDAARVAALTCTRAGAEPPTRAETPKETPVPAAAVQRTVAELVEHARRLAVPGQRRLLGLTGAPGAGKSTVADAIVTALGPELAVLVPMDGFHLSNATLMAWGRRGRKGAWDTFDADGYLALLRRLRHQAEDVVHAPVFDRDVDQSIGSAVPVARDVPLVVTEGNYLLSEAGAWGGVAALLDEAWYLDVDDASRQQRLTLRHQQHGMGLDEAATWARTTDQANAALVARSRDRADLVVTMVTS